MNKILLTLILCLSFFSALKAQTTVKLKLPNPCFSQGIDLKKSNTDLDFKVFPNPNTGRFTLNIKSIKKLGEISIHIYNSSGKLVFEENIYSSSPEVVKSIDLSHLSSSFYTIRIITAEGVKTKKLIINK